MTTINTVYQWEGDKTQPYGSNWVWRSKKVLMPYLTTVGAARVIAALSDREDYYALLVARQDVINRNSARISAGMIGGAIGENLIGVLEVNGDDLETPPTVGAYSGDFNLVFRLYVDDVLKFTKEIYSTKPFRCDDGFRGRSFEFELEGNVTVRRVDYGSSIDDLKLLIQAG